MSVAQSSVSITLVLCELHPHSVQSEYCFCVGALQCIVVSVLVHCGLKLSEYGWVGILQRRAPPSRLCCLLTPRGRDP